MKTIYYITRTFVEPSQGNNCALLRNAQVDFLKQYFKVIVVTPSYNADNKINGDYIKVGYASKLIYPYMERIGILEDYLDTWVKKTLEVLEQVVKEDDILFATCGGELACIKIASLIKRRKKCKFVINFRDPIDYSYIDNKKTGGGGHWHVSREKSIIKYLSNVDLVITSSNKHMEILEDKYNFLKEKVINNYFGYADENKLLTTHIQQLNMRRNKNKRIRLVFGGSMNPPQGAECFIGLSNERNDIDLTYIGQANKKIIKATGGGDIKVLGSMPHDEYLDYMNNNADIGLVSLAAEPYKACFPSKIFEYINLEIPILGALPDGDAKSVINEMGYGKAVEYGNIKEMSRAVDYMLENYDDMVKNIQRDKEKWAMKNTIIDVVKALNKL